MNETARLKPEITILSDAAYELGEGPTYDPASRTLFWFDIVNRKLLRKRLPEGPTEIQDLPLMASALAVVDDARQVLATETGLQIRDAASGRLSMLKEIEAGNAATRSNDARVHPCGALWVGTMGKSQERKAGSIYWFFKGELRRLFPDITIPNALCFAPDGATAYFADTAKNIMFRVACDPMTGLPVGEPQLFVDWRGREGGMDGAICDVHGNVWNARWGAAALDKWSPEGVKLETIVLPVRQPSCPAFIGEAADRIAVTSAWEGMDAQARAADPHAGKTVLIEYAVEGRHEPRLAI